MNLTKRAAFLIDNLDLPEAAQVDSAVWEHFQIAHLCDDSTFRIENKSRQIAWSFLISAEAVANAVLDGISSIFVSINLEEAQEKIRYARRIYDNLNIGGLPAITKPDTLTTIGFSNGARIISSPSKPPRGKAMFWVYPDEWAHQTHDRLIYTGALPIISKGGKLRGGSSPMGGQGVFWEIYTESMRRYPGYTRKKTPWWEVQAFCLNVREARKLAPALGTAARVELFGRDQLKAIFANVPIEDFQQEYECAFIDESSAWITWDEIRRAQDEALKCYIGGAVGTNLAAVMEAIRAAGEAVRTGQIEGVLAGGMDIGRTRNTTEIFLVGQSTLKSYPLRLAITLDNVEFDDQLDVLSEVLSALPVKKLLIDHNGIGRNLAENARRRFPGKAEGVDFTNASKELWAADAKMLIQQGKTPLPANRDIAYQIHSIRRLVTASKNLVFDTERDQKHHADKFWAWALALAAASRPVMLEGPLMY